MVIILTWYGLQTSGDQRKLAPILLSYKEKTNQFSESLQNTKLLTEDLPILHGHVDDDLVGHQVHVVLLLVSADWRNHREPPGFLIQPYGSPSLLHLDI